MNATTSGKAAPPLRSTTVLRTAAASQATANASKGGFASIRLDTHHDSSDIKAALRELEAAFAAPERTEAQSGAAPPPASDPYRWRSRHCADGQVAASSSRTDNGQSTDKTTVVVQRAPASTPPRFPPPPPRKPAKAASVLLQLPPQLLLHCFSFCDLRTLGALCCVSVRMNVIVEQQGKALWTAAAQRRRIPVTKPSEAREQLRGALEQRATARHAEEAFYEGEIARMEERLRTRAQDVYAQNVDVNQTLATSGGSGSSTATRDPFSRHQRGVADRVFGNGAPTSSLADASTPCGAQGTARLQAEVEALEATRRSCESRLKVQEDLLRQQEEQLRRMQILLFPGRDEAIEAAPATVHSSGREKAEKGKVDGAPPLITATQLDAFERRISRLVLDSPTPAAATRSEHGDEAGIPLVLRRGVESFATLELALRALGVAAPWDEPKPQSEAVNEDTGRGCTTTTTNTAAARQAAKRWRAFQQVCPVNEEYANTRCFLQAQDLRARQPGGTVSDSQHVGAQTGRPSAKQTPPLLRLSGFVRRVEAMTDNQVVQMWM